MNLEIIFRRPRQKANDSSPVLQQRKMVSAFVGLSRAVSERVSGGRKICPTYFEIGLTYFKIQGTYFFFAPMWGKRTENQFSLFRAPGGCFPASFFAPFLSAGEQSTRP